jgi:SAM-dependent methyltransferase
MILDLGCGEEKVPGAVGVDNQALPGVDVQHDLLDIPYPFETESADEVYLNHLIEHFELADSRRILSEVYRLLRPGGVMHLRVPHAYTVAAIADPTHKRAFAFVSGEFFDVRSAKSYYKELDAVWQLAITSARVTWFNWKRYRLRQVDTLLSNGMAQLLNHLLRWPNWPGAADLLVRTVPMFFVEIQWDFIKPATDPCASS